MKKILIYTGLASSILVGCTKDFNQINSDPTATTASSFNPNYLLSNTQYDYASAISGYNGPFLFQAGWVQVFASTSSGSANYHTNSDKYVESSNTISYMSRTWDGGYRAASEAFEMKNLTEGKAQYSNLNAVASIMKVLAMQAVTDVYGDVPYAEALQAKTGIGTPVYDKQQAIYTSMLSELEAAVGKLNPAGDKPSSDQYYAGDIAKWKKLGASLMLRLAMRLTKVDAASAKTWTEKAFGLGVFSSNADNAIMKGDEPSGFTNGNLSPLFVTDDLYQVRWSESFINKLKAKSDPRLGVIAEVPGAGLAANNSLAAGNSDPAVQKGLPNGWDLNGGTTDLANSPTFAGATGTGADATKLGKYSRPAGFYRNRSGAFFVLSYAETELLLAEAAARGWSVGANAATHYKNGVSAALQSLSAFGAAATISATTADAFANANPLNTSSLDASLKDINEQYWLAVGSQLNYDEAWSNWRRSGYPVLTPVNYNGNFSGGQIPRRQKYPVSEGSLNGTNLSAAITGLGGGDTWVSRVWWDK